MLFKSLQFMIDHNVETIDNLILIATNREKIEVKLKDIKNKLDSKQYKNAELKDYLQYGIIRYIEQDNTAKTAKFIQDMLTERKPDFLKISIKKVTVLELGTYGYLNSIVEFDL